MQNEILHTLYFYFKFKKYDENKIIFNYHILK